MLILARGGALYARLQLTAGPGAQVVLPVEVDWARWPAWLDRSVDDWPLLVQEWQWSLDHLIHVRQDWTTPHLPGGDPFELDIDDPSLVHPMDRQWDDGSGTPTQRVRCTPKERRSERSPRR